MCKYSKNQIHDPQYLLNFLGRDSPGAGSYEIDQHTISHKISKLRGLPKVDEKRFQEERLREKRFKNS
jgi:hypothetical protein